MSQIQTDPCGILILAGKRTKNVVSVRAKLHLDMYTFVGIPQKWTVHL